MPAPCHLDTGRALQITPRESGTTDRTVAGLASALYLVEDPPELAFITLDERQSAVAAGLGFET